LSLGMQKSDVKGFKDSDRPLGFQENNKTLTRVETDPVNLGPPLEVLALKMLGCWPKIVPFHARMKGVKNP
ncbi:hypothetical protein Ancab_017223, partial [Ancistrocladus abbreviatus]